MAHQHGWMPPLHAAARLAADVQSGVAALDPHTGRGRPQALVLQRRVKLEVVSRDGMAYQECLLP